MVADNIRFVSLDTERQRAVITLHDGSWITDYGTCIMLYGPVTRTAAEIVAATIRHGWTSVTLTGSLAFRDAVALECALREPPVSSDHIFSDEARRRLESQLQERESERTKCVQERAGRAIHAETTRLEAVLLACPPHLARATIKRLAATRYAQLLLSKSHSRIAAVAAGGDVGISPKAAQESRDAFLLKPKGANLALIDKFVASKL